MDAANSPGKGINGSVMPPKIRFLKDAKNNSLSMFRSSGGRGGEFLHLHLLEFPDCLGDAVW